MRSGGLFAGYGGLDMAISEVFDAEPAWFSEIEDAPSKILAHHWPDVPNLGDITKIDWDQVEPVDILGGGFPCQDVSLAGKRAGMTADTRSGLWSYFAAGIAALHPQYVVIENVRGLLSAEAHSDMEPCPWCLGDGPGEPALRALGAVLGDLADLGYDAQWRGLRAADVGSPHGRYRIFVLAQDPARIGSGSSWAHSGEPHRADGPSGAGELTPAHTAELGHERSWPARDWWDGSADNSEPAADAEDNRCVGHSGISSSPGTVLIGTDVDRRPVADTQGDGRYEGWPEPAGELGRPDAAERSDATADARSARLKQHAGEPPTEETRPHAGHQSASDRRPRTTTDWGPYRPAVDRWERVLGRVAPPPTEPNSRGSQRLNPTFVEWMMGLPAGHVTAVPDVNRNAQLKALGNGVVPQQAIAALRHMYANHIAMEVTS